MRKVLIADDEEGVRRLVRLTLEDGDMEIYEAADGEEALTMAREQHPDLLLLDVMMPKVTGVEVCRSLKADEDTADIVIVMLTAKSRTADEEEGRAAGSDHYFTKPFSPVALLRKIDEIFDGRP